jgi:hypothetical protein
VREERRGAQGVLRPGAGGRQAARRGRRGAAWGLAPFTVAADAFLRAEKASGWSLYYCPMVDAYWIQTREGVENPYEPGMLRCGSKVDRVERG